MRYAQCYYNVYFYVLDFGHGEWRDTDGISFKSDSPSTGK